MDIRQIKIGGKNKMNPTKEIVGEYEDEVAGQVKKAKKGGPATSGEEIVDNIL